MSKSGQSKSSLVRKYLLQFDRLILTKVVLHRTYAQDEAKSIN